MSGEILSYPEAHALVAAYARRQGALRRPSERVRLAEARDRVLGQPLVADLDQPPFARATRDGFACRAGEAMRRAWLPVAGTTRAGAAPPGALEPGSAWEIMTGAPMPPGADAVVMIEHTEREGDRVRLAPPRRIHAGENVVARAAQARAGEELLPAGTRLGAAQIALAASLGYAEIAASARPRVAILTTGDELVSAERVPGPGQIRNSNAPMLAALVTEAGGEAALLPAAGDTAEALDAVLAASDGADLLLISGGVSAGRFDLVEPALLRRGAQFFFTGVRMQPGKPLVFGETPRAEGALPFFGLPGNPISSAATFLLFARQVVAALGGERATGPRFLAAQLARPANSGAKPGLTRFLPAHCRFDDGGEAPQVETVPWQGSGDLPAFARANCFLVVPEESGTLAEGVTVRILMI